MPDSLIAQLVNEAWDDSSKIVSNGLVFDNGLSSDKQKTLSDVVIVVTDKLAATTWQPSHYTATGGGRTCVRQSATGEKIFDYMHRFHLDYDALRSPSLDAIKAWSASARRFELRACLRTQVAADREWWAGGRGGGS
jgi:hypothetical protein